MLPRRVFLAAGFAAVRRVALRVVLAFDRVALGFSTVLIVIVSEALGAVALTPAATFIDSVGLSGEAG